MIYGMLKIKTISLTHYQIGMLTLPPEDVAILLAEVDKVMKI
jgi:hypothetical protein